MKRRDEEWGRTPKSGSSHVTLVTHLIPFPPNCATASVIPSARLLIFFSLSPNWPSSNSSEYLLEAIPRRPSSPLRDPTVNTHDSIDTFRPPFLTPIGRPLSSLLLTYLWGRTHTARIQTTPGHLEKHGITHEREITTAISTWPSTSTGRR